MIKAILFDVDNTLVDLMLVKKVAVEAAVDAMLDVGLQMPKDEMSKRIWDFYAKFGYEHQQVFYQVLKAAYGEVDHRLL